MEPQMIQNSDNKDQSNFGGLMSASASPDTVKNKMNLNIIQGHAYGVPTQNNLVSQASDTHM
jgi:hypothetical protein